MQIFDILFTAYVSLCFYVLFNLRLCYFWLKSCVSKSKLIRYYRTHTGEKRFACLVCDRKFAQKIHLVWHQATHSEVRSFKCFICPEGRYF